MLFMVYPAVSTATMSSFNCDSNLGLLKVDYRELCPSAADFTFWWSIAFFILYPVGIPIFMHRACVFEGIQQIVKEKLDSANFQSMLSMFLQRGVSIESSRFARMVGSAASEETFNARANEEYDKILALQGDGDLISLDSLEKLVHKLDDGTQESEMENEKCKSHMWPRELRLARS